MAHPERPDGAPTPGPGDDLIERCYDELKVLVGRMLRKFPGVHRRERTSDMYQDVVVKLLKVVRSRPFAEPADLFRCAVRVTRNHLIDQARRMRPELFAPAAAGGSTTGPLADLPAGPSGDPGLLACWGEFHAAVHALPDDQRELFDLLYYMEMTLPRAAAVLGVPESTLKKRWRAARLELARRFPGGPPV
ncbi:MAG: sigma-70 family RNA polymerase sigma factor [Gemmataceae bacterium]|nr:sigma-70 family RNA polymerase sigma factor [Gemmataceae bacterium]